MSDLVKRLREDGLGWGIGPALMCQEAAARIEALEAALGPIKTLVDVAELDRSWRHAYPDDEVAVLAYGNETQDGKNVCKTHSITWGWLRHAASLLEKNHD